MTYTLEQAKILREQNPFDARNIRDCFKNKNNESIQEELNITKVPCIAIIENLVNDFNIAQIIRSANAFNIDQVYICGRRKWNRRGSVGTHHYIHIEYWEHIQEAIQQLRDREYRIVAAELTDDAVSLVKYSWRQKSALVFGEEGRGLSQLAIDMADDVVYIPMLGTVRSFNVAGTAQMMLYDYMKKNEYI